MLFRFITIKQIFYNVGICFFKENVANFENVVTTENNIPSPVSMDQPAPEEPHQLHSDQFQPPEDNVPVSDESLSHSRSQSVSEEQKTCLTVQPNRILCGVSILNLFSRPYETMLNATPAHFIYLLFFGTTYWQGYLCFIAATSRSHIFCRFH